MSYKNQDRQYLSRQLNGPIVTGFATAIYNFLHSFVDTNIEYLDNLSIATADSEHLTSIGKLMGFPRLYAFNDASLTTYFTFYNGYFKIYQAPFNGFSDEYVAYDGSAGWTQGGIFSGDSGANFIVEIPTELFRTLLLILSDVNIYTVNSIIYIDKITSILLNSTDYTVAYDSTIPNKLNITVSTSVNQLTVVILTHILNVLYTGIIDIEVIQE